MKPSLIVQKYGGTSVGSIERIRAVAKRVAHTVEQGHRVVVVVSAMGDETDRLVQLAEQLLAGSPTTPSQQREWDMLLSTGEQVSIALLALALQQLGYTALSMTAAQVGIFTTRDHMRARILEIHTERLQHHLERGEVVVVAGFQGITSPTELEITTLGRGGSDTTAVALAVALQAQLCEIYTDVPGVFTTDPRKVPEARLLPEITSAEMLELASLGAQVLHPRSVEIARNYGVKLRVRSSLLPFQGEEANLGTFIVSPPAPPGIPRGGLEMGLAVDTVEVDRDQAKLVLVGVPDRPGIAAQLFQGIAAAGVNVDLILQSLQFSPEDASLSTQPTNDIAFTVSRSQVREAAAVAQRIGQELGCEAVMVDEAVAKVSIAGVGMIGRPGIAAQMFQVLAKAGINLQMISMSEMKVSCVVAAERAGDAALALGESFQVIPRLHRPQPFPRDPLQPAARHPVRGIALDLKQSRLGIRKVPDRPGTAAHLFGQLAAAGVIVDTIIQSQRGYHNGIPSNDIAFTVPQDQAGAAEAVCQQVARDLQAAGVDIDHEIAKVSIVGAEMEAHPGVAAHLFATLAAAGINIEMIATSEIKVSCVVRREQGLLALRTIHRAFELDKP
ncbi:aspartate kinase [Thermostichus vulcanus]|uniref:aspartate kinase n=1 Tax=Thermostichus vulcanus str. 'Rupite' TaxID=2813851 RepID=A0ABT0C915_THEVL|nr:aspartate kinase [Thermostichus vulcanus]MCJ2542269.1 aspartate kinase [Thermostichus vulcanus str. 'Rupite']